MILTLVLGGLVYGLLTCVGSVLATRARLERQRHDLLRHVAELRQNHIQRVRARRAEILALQQKQLGFGDDVVEVDILDDEPPLAQAA